MEIIRRGSGTDFHMVVKADLILAFNYASNTISHLQHQNTCLNSQISSQTTSELESKAVSLKIFWVQPLKNIWQESSNDKVLAKKVR